MPLPRVRITQSDGNLGIVAPNPRALLKIGFATGGVANTMYGIGSTGGLISTLGYGPLAQAVSQDLEVAGGPVYAMPVAPTINDAYTYCSQTPVHLGSGSAVVFATSIWSSAVITIVDATHYQVSVGGGPAMGPFVITPGSDQVLAGTFTAVQWAGSGTIVAGDVFTCNTDGTVTHTSGTGTATLTQAKSLPLDTYSLLLTITKGGAPGTAQFTYSLDGGANTSLVITSPATVSSHAYYLIPNTGIFLDFGSATTFVLGDTFQVKYTPGCPSDAAVTGAIDAFVATYLQTPVFGIHVVGSPSSAANAQSLAGAVDAKLVTLASTYFKYLRALTSCPTRGPTSGTTGTIILDGSGYAIVDTADTDSVVAAAFNAHEYKHVGVGAGEVIVISGLDGIEYRRNIAFVAASELAGVNAATDASAVRLGSLAGVDAILRDEFLSGGVLDDARFITARTWTGLPGFYLSNVKTMAIATSDYSRFANARVIDEASAIAYAESAQYVSASIPTKPDGTIQEKAAKTIESEIGAALRANLIHSSPPDATAVDVTVDRSNNILATSTLNITIGVTPFGYASYIEITIGFKVSQ